MPETPAFLVERMRSEGDKTLEFFLSLSHAEWEREVYSEGTCWTVHKILAHFVASEAGFGLLMRSVLQGGEGAPEGLDIDIYNDEWVGKLEGLSNTELLERFKDNRRANAELIAGVHPADLQRIGRHPFLGMAPLVDIIKLVYRHNGIHIRDIRQRLAERPGES